MSESFVGCRLQCADGFGTAIPTNPGGRKQKLTWIFCGVRTMNGLKPHVKRSMNANQRSHRFIYFSAGMIALSGLVAVAFPGTPAIAAKDSRDDFRRCAANLARLELPEEEVVSACSRAFNPQGLWNCVTDVTRGGYTATDALNACRQVRQPEEMASCVSSIRRTLRETSAPEILDSCRRSLLPVRYSDCVVGVSRGGADVATNALRTCNDELYFPREVDPTFIPYTADQPSLITPDTLAPTAPVTPAPETVAPPPAPSPAPAAPVRGLY